MRTLADNTPSVEQFMKSLESIKGPREPDIIWHTAVCAVGTRFSSLRVPPVAPRIGPRLVYVTNKPLIANGFFRKVFVLVDCAPRWVAYLRKKLPKTHFDLVAVYPLRHDLADTLLSAIEISASASADPTPPADGKITSL